MHEDIGKPQQAPTDRGSLGSGLLSGCLFNCFAAVLVLYFGSRPASAIAALVVGPIVATAVLAAVHSSNGETETAKGECDCPRTYCSVDVALLVVGLK